MSTFRLAIIADDLTGALDAAAPFAGGDLSVVVATRPEAFPEVVASGADIIAVSTRSREIPETEAHRRVARMLAELPVGIRVMKKVDSRLKGNVAAELDAFGAARFLVLPAIPDFGRITSGGAVRGFGVDRPIDIRSTLGNAAHHSSFPDTATQGEIRDAVIAAAPETVLVGARGLSVALAELAGQSCAPDLPPLPQPVVFAVGSTDPITLSQVETLRAARPETRHLPAPSGVAPAPAGPLDAITILQATPGQETPPTQVAASFARTVIPYLRVADAMLLTGGATAEAILDALGVWRLSVEGEVLPGLPLCRAKDRTIVTKSGGFGQKGTFLALLDGPKCPTA